MRPIKNSPRAVNSKLPRENISASLWRRRRLRWILGQVNARILIMAVQLAARLANVLFPSHCFVRSRARGAPERRMAVFPALRPLKR